MWQKLRKPTLQDESPKFIGAALILLFLGQLVAGTFLFRLKVTETPDFNTIRKDVITNCTMLFNESRAENESLYDILVVAQSSLRESKQPQIVRTVIAPIATLNMMLGIRENLDYPDKLVGHLYFLSCNIIMFFIMISLCHILDEKHNKRFDSEWTMAPCPPRDILLDFRKQLEEAEREGREVQFKVCSLDKPMPPEHLRKAFLWPVRYPRPALMCLIFFIIFSMVLSVVLLLIDNVGFFQSLTKILNYTNMIKPFPLDGSVWTFLMWILAFIDLIIFNYTIYSLSLLFLDVIFWIVGVEEEFTPVLLE